MGSPRPNSAAKPLAKAYKTALRSIAEAASLYGELQQRTKSAINHAMRWASDYAHELAVSELKIVKWHIENGDGTPDAILRTIDELIAKNERESHSGK